MSELREEDYILHGPPLEYITEYTSAGKFIFDRLQKNPAFIGQIEAHTGHKYTYGEILDHSIRLALWLRDMDIGPGDIVSYATYNHKDVIIVVYATLFVGAILNTWELSGSTEEIVYLMDTMKPKIVICCKDVAILVRTVAKESHVAPKFLVHGELSGFISFKDTQIRSKIEIDNFQCTEVEENDVALLMATSGTTALPKIVPKTQKSILMVAQILEKQPFTGPVFITFAPLGWITGMQHVLLGPSAKVQRVVAAYFDEESACKWIEVYQVNHTTITLAIFLRMIHYHKISNYDISSLRMVLVVGTRLCECYYEKFKKFAPIGSKLFQRYGITEFFGAVTAVHTGEIFPGSSGKLIPGASGKIIDLHTGKIISPYELGELCVKHPNTFLGYYNDPTSSNSVIDSDGWYHTGDVAKFDKNGELFVIDRLIDMIDFKGVKVSPSELEAIILEHPEVEHVGVVGKRISSSVEHPVAFVVKTFGSNLTEAELCNFLKSRVVADAQQLRGGVRFIHAMPLSISGKTKRYKLREMLELEK